MKYVACFLISALFAICLWGASITAVAADGKNTERQVKAGVFNFEGYHSKNDEGALEGYGIDLLAALSEYSHLNFLPTGFENSWQDMQEMLKNGEIDIVSSARRTPAREEIFAFSLPVGRNHTTLFKQLHNTKIKAGEYSTYNGIKIGAIKNSSQNQYIKNHRNITVYQFNDAHPTL